MKIFTYSVLGEIRRIVKSLGRCKRCLEELVWDESEKGYVCKCKKIKIADLSKRVLIRKLERVLRVLILAICIIIVGGSKIECFWRCLEGFKRVYKIDFRGKIVFEASIEEFDSRVDWVSIYVEGIGRNDILLSEWKVEFDKRVLVKEERGIKKSYIRDSDNISRWKEIYFNWWDFLVERGVSEVKIEKGKERFVIKLRR